DNVINTPIFDAIAEVKITDSLSSAQYGTGGILYNQISKGGTNQFHGMGYDYFRNTIFNAANFQFGLNAPRAPIHYNAFGGNIGGPVIKNRVFFFFAVENVINHGGASVNLTTVPSNAMRSGDFSGLNPIYDPTTQVVNPTSGVVTRQPFPGNKIPATLIDPVAKAIQGLYPTSNLGGNFAAGAITNNYNYALPSSSPLRKYFGRFDADITPNNRITGSAAWNDAPSVGLSPVCPVNCLGIDIFNTNNQISDYWSINPGTTNEFRLGFMGEYDLLTPQTLAQGWPAKLGLQFAKADIFPTVNITGFYGLGPGIHSNYKENLFDLSDQVTLVRGRHILHFGGEVLINRADSTAWGNINAATLGFTGVYTAGSNIGSLASTSGSPYADFLLGYAKSWSASVSPEYGGRLKNPGIFVQDDFKVNPKLTLNLGLRWEGNTGWSEIHGNERSFDPTIINPATNAPGAIWYTVTAANGRHTLQASQWNNWLPRVGFAYLLGDNTTIRGGFGVYTFPWNVDTYGNGLGNAFTASGSETDSTNNVQPVVILGSDGNTNYQGSKGASINSLYQLAPTTPNGYNGQAVGFTQYHSPVPLLKSWNLTVQRSISANMFADIGYVGSHGAHLPWLTDLNQVPQNLLGPNDAALRPYPEFQSITGVTTASISNYDALQAGITRRMTSGLMFNFNYTFSHMLSNQDSSGWGSKQGNQPYQNAYVPSENYGPSNFDIRHMFKGQAIYNLPFGRGRTFLNQNSALDEAIGGWTLSGTIVAQTGNPFTPYMAVNNSYALSTNAVWYPNVVGSPTLSNPTINSWFNVNALAAPIPGTFGNMGRNILYGPGLTQLNLSLQKTFVITERIKLDFNLNSTNALNHPSFALPDLLIGPGHIGRITGVTVGGRQMELVGKLRF
ncbi:MAG: TonB-dependent receptor, partial [Verrucomicrobia bacterium]|nr:TonB-dependent receptor [Verrucomicrobiota bacterium]